MHEKATEYHSTTRYSAPGEPDETTETHRDVCRTCYQRQDDGEIRAADWPCSTVRIREAARSILWMAREYAVAGGRSGPEMEDYEAAVAIIGED